MSKQHDLKCRPQYFDAIYRKPFELRFNDRNFEEGDVLLLREWDLNTETYTGRQCYRQIIYILSKYPGLVPGYVILGLGPWHTQKDAAIAAANATLAQ